MTDDHATFLRKWAADIRNSSGQSVDADRLDEIAAALSALPAGVKPKPLEWKYDTLALVWRASCPIGHYTAWSINGHAFFGFSLTAQSPTRVDGGGDDEAAKAAAQADYSARILSAIYPAGVETPAPTPSPQPNVAGETAGLKPIPIEAAKRIAKEYGYDQVLIYGRRCHDTPEPHGEHMTTYGRTREHCDVAACIGDTLKKFMGWEV